MTWEDEGGAPRSSKLVEEPKPLDVTTRAIMDEAIQKLWPEPVVVQVHRMSAKEIIQDFKAPFEYKPEAPAQPIIEVTPIKAKTSILKLKCEECGKPAVEESHITVTVPKEDGENMKLVKMKVTTLVCGHLVSNELESVRSFDDIVSFHHKRPFPYQKTTCKKVVKAGFRALIRLDMGLGKTIVSAMLGLKYSKELSPILIVCKASMTTQWAMEWLEWTNQPVQIIMTARERPEKGFKAIIVSMDLLRRLKWLDSYAPKTVIFDEVQHIKNPDAQRTRMVQELAKRAKHFIALSGKPIKNNFGEYFNVLNIIDPLNFGVRQRFFDEYVHYYHDDQGRLRVGGLLEKTYEKFTRITKPYTVDYKREDVMPDLPRIFRQNRFAALTDEDEEAYRKEMSTFLDAYDESEAVTGQAKFEAKQAVGQSIMRLRQIVGIAKVETTVEHVLDWIDEHDEEKLLLEDGDLKIIAKPKIVIFVHHVAVGTLIQSRLDEELKQRGLAPTIRLLGGISGDKSAEIENEFKTNPLRRVLVASTLASGEGKNFQFCADAVLHERQWNPPNEEQAEARFPRPGSTAQSVNIVYPIALGTVDEILTEIVERKRGYLATVDGKWVALTENEVMAEMMNKLVTEGRARWRP